jgi:hypothetical protein
MIREAYELGRLAFLSGKKNIPFYDKALSDLIKGRGGSAKTYIDYSDSWSKGYLYEMFEDEDKLTGEREGERKAGMDEMAMGGYMAKGGMVVTSIKNIPNFKERLDEGKITYRGLGMGKLYDDFYKLAGQTGTRIKVDGKEYFITDEEFDTFSRGEDGKMRIRFDAPQRKGYAYGGMTDNDGGLLANGKYRYYKGDEGMYKGDEVRVYKFDIGSGYTYDVLNEDGKPKNHNFAKTERFEKDFKYFPRAR